MTAHEIFCRGILQEIDNITASLYLLKQKVSAQLPSTNTRKARGYFYDPKSKKNIWFDKAAERKWEKEHSKKEKAKSKLKVIKKEGGE